MHTVALTETLSVELTAQIHCTVTEQLHFSVAYNEYNSEMTIKRRAQDMNPMELDSYLFYKEISFFCGTRMHELSST
jgi:hypothetical protein